MTVVVAEQNFARLRKTTSDPRFEESLHAARA